MSDDSPQLFDPDAFAAAPDPVEVHDLEIDPSELVDVESDDDESEPLLEEPIADPEIELDDDDDEALAAAIDADLAHVPVADALLDDPDPEPEVEAELEADAVEDVADIEAAAAPELEVEAEPVSQSVLDTVLSPDTVVERISVGAPPVLRAVAGGRHEARERAAHLLYEVEIKSLSVDEVLDEQVLAPDTYASELVKGVAAHRDELDEIIGRLARGWTIKRMPTMDVVVLRLAVYELAHRPEVPRGVVLSEAVDLAGQYGTDDSSKFVNGLLAAAANELRPSA
ncbi:hypothetical protein BH10ACT3_BH10ACT3_08930 [soil metagenome]